MKLKITILFTLLMLLCVSLIGQTTHIPGDLNVGGTGLFNGLLTVNSIVVNSNINVSNINTINLNAGIVTGNGIGLTNIAATNISFASIFFSSTNIISGYILPLCSVSNDMKYPYGTTGCTNLFIPTVYTNDVTCIPIAGNLDQWPMLDGSGSIAVDVGSGANNLTLTGSPTWIASPHGGGGLTLNGSSQSASTTASVTLPGNTFSFSIWFKTSSSATQIIAELGPNFNSVGPAWVIYISGGQLVGNYNASSSLVQSSSSGYADGSWHHMVMTMDNTIATPWKLYIDGNAAAATYGGSGNSGGFISNTIYIGARSGAVAPFDGSITDPRIYTTILTSDDVAAIYAADGATCP